MSVVRLSFCSENFHIFNQGCAKTLLICMCQLLNSTKLIIFYRKYATCFLLMAAKCVILYVHVSVCQNFAKSAVAGSWQNAGPTGRELPQTPPVGSMKRGAGGIQNSRGDPHGTPQLRSTDRLVFRKVTLLEIEYSRLLSGMRLRFSQGVFPHLCGQLLLHLRLLWLFLHSLTIHSGSSLC